jgi:hypothetical protein
MLLYLKKRGVGHKWRSILPEGFLFEKKDERISNTNTTTP